MPRGIFTLKQQLQGVREKSWNNALGNTYSAKFAGSGSGQYLTGPTTSALNFSTGNFSVELWVYLNAIPSSLAVIFSASNATADWQLGYSSSNYFYWHNSGIQLTSTSIAPAYGRWTHVALVRSGTTVSLFVNGMRASTVTNSAAVNLTNFNIGSYWTGPTSYMVDGWVSNLRVTNTVVYDPTLTTLILPTGPLTAISGTQLLTLQNATIVDNSTNALTITNNGSVATQIVNPFGLQLKTPAVDYLVVAGGGGGGTENSGGGGAGGLLQGSLPVISSNAYTITIGAGGAGVSSSNFPGSNGLNSVFGSITTIGGGGGGSRGAGGNASATNGGSGGGGGSAGYYVGTYPTATYAGGFGVSGQGNSGGTYVSGSPTWSGAGGGGAGSKAPDSTVNNASQGGMGIASDITGTRTAYAGGGGGGNRGTSPVGIGGTGGGGTGANDTAATSGSANTGGGGGGGGQATAGGTGGSGIVVISYPDIYAGAAATTGSPTVSTSGSGSISLNGSNQYISLAASATTDLGSSNFTYEFWYYCSSTSQRQGFLCSATDYWFGIDYQTLGGFGLGLWASSTGSSWNLINSDNGGNGITNTTPILNSWNHIAVSRSSTSWAMWLNGTRILSLTVAGSIVSRSSEAKRIGTWAGATNFPLYGYISNNRMVIGSAVYSPSNSTITVPTAPLTAITNTQVLLNCVSGSSFTDSSTNALTVTLSNTPTWNQASPFATGLGYKNRVYTYTASGTITF